VLIRESQSLKVIQLFACQEEIQDISWAPNETHLFCGLLKRGIIQVWSSISSEWVCRITEGVAGIAYARWSPDSRHILTVSEFQVLYLSCTIPYYIQAKLTIWNLHDGSSILLPSPKHSSSGLCFDKKGVVMVLLERKECRDWISVYSIHQWELLRKFPVETRDATDLALSPDSQVIALWESSVEYSIYFYSLDGRKLSQYTPYNDFLGIRTVTWSGEGLLAIGSYDQQLRIITPLTWCPIATFPHPEVVNGNECVVYQEVQVDAPPYHRQCNHCCYCYYYCCYYYCCYMNVTRIRHNRKRPGEVTNSEVGSEGQPQVRG
jgi:WD40 repeat protein